MAPGQIRQNFCLIGGLVASFGREIIDFVMVVKTHL